MVAFIDTDQERIGVETIYMQLPIAPSVYYRHKARPVDPTRLPPRRVYHGALLGRVPDARLGTARGKRGARFRTTVQDDRADRPVDHVNR